MLRINIPESEKPRVVIVGGGFAGLNLARKLNKSGYYQIVLLDRNNFHQFQPLLYQVSMSGLEPSSIVFPFRKIFQRNKEIFIRVTEVESVDTVQKRVHTPLGICNYDYLVVATGVQTNFFGQEEIAEKAITMKTVSEALFLRNRILTDYEKALSITDYETRRKYLDIVIVGGGPTGVEIAGALAEMREFVLPKDYPEMNPKEVKIHLIQSGGCLLKGMSDKASKAALRYLKELGVEVHLNTRVTNYNGEEVNTNRDLIIPSFKMIWAAGVKGAAMEGLTEKYGNKANRIKVNHFNQIEDLKDVFVLGDLAYIEDEKYPYGHPQLAQVAIQQANLLAKNLRFIKEGRALQAFQYKDLGAMATIGRHRSVVDLPRWKFTGFFAWVVWLFVHLFQILGVKNKIVVIFNWAWNYITFDQSLRLIIRPKIRSLDIDKDED